jgi:hypothetical protein
MSLNKFTFLRTFVATYRSPFPLFRASSFLWFLPCQIPIETSHASVAEAPCSRSRLKDASHSQLHAFSQQSITDLETKSRAQFLLPLKQRFLFRASFPHSAVPASSIFIVARNLSKWPRPSTSSSVARTSSCSGYLPAYLAPNLLTW